MYGTHLPTSMYFRVFSSFLDDAADVLPHWDLASDTKLRVSSTAFTYNACTMLQCINYTQLMVTRCEC